MHNQKLKTFVEKLLVVDIKKLNEQQLAEHMAMVAKAKTMMIESRNEKVRKIAEAPKVAINFDVEDLKRLEQIKDLPTLKSQAFALISKPSTKPMKPEKVTWFKNALEKIDSPIKVIKLMYDLMLSGEGNSVLGSRNSMSPNSYRQRFGEGEYDQSHGSPYDRGGADSWYSRPRHPHKGGVGGDSGPRIEDLTPDEIKAYHAGYDDNERSGGKKQWESITNRVTENDEQNPVVNSISRRIMMQRLDLLSKYGAKAVMDAIDEVAEFVGSVDEIGSSDVSAWVKQVEDNLSQNNIQQEAQQRLSKVFDFSNYKG